MTNQSPYYPLRPNRRPGANDVTDVPGNANTEQFRLARNAVIDARTQPRCVVCATTQHTSEVHVRRLPYDEARSVVLDMTPCAAHFACIGLVTCQKPGADRD